MLVTDKVTKSNKSCLVSSELMPHLMISDFNSIFRSVFSRVESLLHLEVIPHPGKYN